MNSSEHLSSVNPNEETRKIEKDPINAQILEALKNPQRINELVDNKWTRVDIDGAPVIVGKHIGDIATGLRAELFLGNGGKLIEPRVRTFTLIKKQGKPPVIGEEHFIEGSIAAERAGAVLQQKHRWEEKKQGL